MLTSILKSNTISAFVLGYLLSVGILINRLASIQSETLNTDLLYTHWAFGWLEKGEDALPYLSIVIVSVLAVISRLRIRETKKAIGNNNLSMLLLVCLIINQPNALARPDVLVATLLSFAAFMLLISTYKQESVLSELFHVSLLIGGASVFVGQCLILMAAVLFSILVLRTGRAKEWLVLSLGLTMTAVFITMVTIWSDNPLLTFQRVIQSSWSGKVELANLNLGNVLMLPAILAGFVSLLNSITAGTVAERNIALACTSWLVGILFMVLILGLGWQNGIIFAAFPLSVFTAKALEGTKRWWMADLLLLASIAAPFLSSLWQL